MSYLIIACALVAAVVLSVVGALSIFVSREEAKARREASALEDLRLSMQQQLNELRQSLEQHSNAELRAEVDALAAAATKHAASVRKQFGTVWAEFQRYETADEPEFLDDEQQLQLPGVGAPPACSCGWCQSCKARANGAMVRS